jgi:hypothetical protein
MSIPTDVKLDAYLSCDGYYSASKTLAVRLCYNLILVITAFDVLDLFGNEVLPG